MKYIIAIGFGIIFALFATATAMPFAGDAPPISALFFGSLCGGLYLGLSLADSIAYKPKRKSRRPRTPIARSDRPFPERLENFVCGHDCGETDKSESATSQMPLWRLEVTHEPTPPKTSSFIRDILYRIRSILTSQRK